LQIITHKESDLEKEDSMLELETGTNYSEDNAHEVEKEDKDCNCCRFYRVWQESRRLVLGKETAEEDETESWNEKANCQWVAGCEQCYWKVEENIWWLQNSGRWIWFLWEKFSCTVEKDAIATCSDLSTKATRSNDEWKNVSVKWGYMEHQLSSSYLILLLVNLLPIFSTLTPPRGSTGHSSPSCGQLKWCHWLIFLMLYSCSFLYNELIVPANWFFKLQH